MKTAIIVAIIIACIALLISAFFLEPVQYLYTKF